MNNTAIKSWIEAARVKLGSGEISKDDLRDLESILDESHQKVLYLYSKSTNMRSAISSWALYNPTVEYEPSLPSQDPPYESVVEALGDGWRIVQFPISKLYQFSDIDNDYLGFEFILEKLTNGGIGQ